MPIGTGTYTIAEDGSILLDAKGLFLYDFFVGDANHNPVIGTDFLSKDAGRSIRVMNAGNREDNTANALPTVPEGFGALDTSGLSLIGSAIPTFADPDTPEIPIWPATAPKDTWVNVDISGLQASGNSLWLWTKSDYNDHSTLSNLLAVHERRISAGGSYVIGTNQSIVLDGMYFDNEVSVGGDFTWDLNCDGHTDATGPNPTLTFDYLTNHLGLRPGDNTIACVIGWDVSTATLTIIPEPATFSLLALGGVAMLRRRG